MIVPARAASMWAAAGFIQAMAPRTFTSIIWRSFSGEYSCSSMVGMEPLT